MKVIITVKGLAHSSPRDDLTKVDLLDADAAENVIETFAPDWVIHCAAERRPDAAEQDRERAQKLNATVPATLADLSSKYNFVLVYISTDYVFDGTSPPYEVDDAPNPLQFYGQSKRDGEIAILRDRPNGQRIVLRVPILYGPADKNADTAVNTLIDVLQDQSGKKYNMDHYATRYPTNTLDIASFLRRLVEKCSPTLSDPSDPDSSKVEPAITTLPPIIHYSAAEPFTKYEMCLAFAEILRLPHDHIIPDSTAPTGAVTRPRDTKLSTKVVEETLGMDIGAGGFVDYWTAVLG
ncbi:hypothetical protein FRB99_006449 [Tulasnella sp. 403]|nr:hypothetical protein FRB99_006449 [Tulasnella sp. 403]